MKNLVWMIVALLVVAPACKSGSTEPGGAGGGGGGAGTGGQVSTGGAGGTGQVEVTALEASCNAEIAAMYATPCPSTQLTENQALAQCLVQALSLADDCGQEIVDYNNCFADGGYTCSAAGTPTPNSTCVAEVTALQTCQAKAPCKAYCAEAKEAGCGAADCEQACLARQAQLVHCENYYGGLVSCWAGSLTCSGGKPVNTGCEESIGSVGWCIATFAGGTAAGDCEGYCWAAETLGCGAGCAADCAAKINDATCGYQYRNILRCAVDLQELNLTCAGGVPTPGTACDNDISNYQACTGN